MLRELSVRSFALIDEVDVTFGPGMTCLVGETGAGKSILIDALAAALGSRVSSDLIRPGAKKAVIEATFDVESLPSVVSLLQEHELDWEAPHLILRRELTASGTSRCFINDTPSTVSVARQLAEHLMDFHGQHDTYGLLDVRHHRVILDGIANVGPQLSKMRSAWDELQQQRQAYDTLLKQSLAADEERNRLDFVIREIDEVDPKPSEDVEIVEELRRAESREQVVNSAQGARETLYSGESSAYEQLVAARRYVRELLPFDASMEGLLAELDAAISTVQEGAIAVSRLTDAEDFSPERIEELRTRLMLLQRMVKRYGSLEEAISVRKALEQERHDLEDIDTTLAVQKSRVESLEADALATASLLSKQRKKTIGPLSQSIQKTLTGLGMPSAVVDIQLHPVELGPTGKESVEILFSANAGEEIRPLAKIASGGELSRFMLALKKAQVADSHISSMVFDEIDTGISGRIARKVGEEMLALSTANQVLCITHLPQIASLATTMIRVEKSEEGGRATVHAHEIHRAEMVEEVARLMSGAEISDATLASAAELMAPTLGQPE